jgi:hypothetical protein
MDAGDHPIVAHEMRAHANFPHVRAKQNVVEKSLCTQAGCARQSISSCNYYKLECARGAYTDGAANVAAAIKASFKNSLKG